MGQIADILQARGELDEAVRIRREEELPVYERPRGCAVNRRWECEPSSQLASARQCRGLSGNRRFVLKSLSDAVRYRLAVAEPIRNMMKRLNLLDSNP
jgi:hypothetical protein